MVDSNQTGGGVGGRLGDGDEFKGPERCVGDSFGFDGGLKEDTHPPPLPVDLGPLWKEWVPPSMSPICDKLWSLFESNTVICFGLQLPSPT